jgi:type I restriction enzyme S subunit
MTETSKHIEKKLPKTWKWVKLGEVATYLNGRAFKPTEWEEAGKPIIRIQNLNKHDAKYNYTKEQFEEKYKVVKGDLLFAWSASLGAYIWRGEEAWLNQHIFKVVPKDFTDKNYLFYLLEKIVQELYAKAHGSGMVHVTKGKFESTEIPLPPKPAQLAIVSKIEELFSELDKGIEQLKTAQQQLKTYRQAVLKWAFEGKLTEEWRTAVRDRSSPQELSMAAEAEVAYGKESDLPEGWKWVKFGDVHEIKSNLVNALEYLDSPHIAPDNISKGTAQLLSYKTIGEDKVFSPKHKFFKGQILYSKIRPNLSKVIIAPIDGLCSADMYPIDSKLNNQFTLYYMLTNYFVSKASNTESRTVLPKINQKGLNEIPFPLCSYEEQNRIVQEIESRFSIADKMEESINQSLQQAEALRQSILKKAFEGRLLNN